MRQVRAPERVARRAASPQLAVVELEAGLAQPIGHRQHSPLAVRAQVFEGRAERGIAVVDQVAQDVQLLVGLVHRGQLRRRHHLDARLGSRRQRLLDARDRVVVGQRQQLYSGRGRGAHDRGRRQFAVGVQRVRLQVERRSHRA